MDKCVQNKKAVIRIFALLYLFFSFEISFAQNIRLDLNLGFREFQFKTTKSNYSSFDMKSIDFYHWPEILEVFSVKYAVRIGNTRTDSVHVFFLGNQLVRTTVFLEDSLNTIYLEKNFGEKIPINEPSLSEEDALNRMKESHSRYFYVSKNIWDAKFVRMGQKEMYIRNGNLVAKKKCLDFYLIDFEDMMKAIMKE